MLLLAFRGRALGVEVKIVPLVVAVSMAEAACRGEARRSEAI